MASETKTKTLTLDDLIIRFLASRRTRAGGTLDHYRIILSKFRWYARTYGWPADPNLITRSHLQEFLDYVATEKHRWPEAPRSSYKKAAPATVHHYGRTIKTLFNWADEEEYLDDNPSRRLKLGSPCYKEVEPYSDDEVRAFLQVCEDDARFRYRFLGIRNKAIISLFIDTGLRLSELANIRLADLDPKLRQVRVMGKGAKTRIVPINGEARKALKRYLEIRPREGEELWKTSDDLELAAEEVKRRY